MTNDLERRLAKVEQTISEPDTDHSLRDALTADGIFCPPGMDDAALFRMLLDYLTGKVTLERLVSANERPKN